MRVNGSIINAFQKTGTGLGPTFFFVEKSAPTFVVIFGPFVANLSHFFPEPLLIYWRYC